MTDEQASTQGAAPTLTLADAARECGVHPDTIRRRKDELVKLGAIVTPNGWTIPIPALVQSGLLGRRTSPPTVEAPSPTTVDHDDDVRALRAQLSEAQRDAAEWKARAEERDRIIAATEQLAASYRLQIEPPKPAPEPAPATPPVAAVQASEPTTQGFGRRLRGVFRI